MSVNLQKGQKISLSKEKPGLKNVLVGLGWDTNKYDGGFDFDLDTAAFLLGSNDKCQSDADFVFYGNLHHNSGAVSHLGDNLTGDGEGDDEQIIVDLIKIPANITKIAFTVSIHEAEQRRQNFGQVSNSFIRIVDKDTNTEIVRYDLGEDYSIETAMIVGEIYKHNDEWKFNAIGNGYQGGLVALCANYGLQVN